MLKTSCWYQKDKPVTLQSSSTSIQRMGNETIGLFTEFSWSEDRYRHTIGMIDADQRVDLVVSCESLADVLWPISPAMQQVYKQNIEDDPVLLGVGMAGKSHFSSSLLMKKAKNTLQVYAEFACLTKDENEVEPDMKTTYRFSEAARHSQSHNQIVFNFDSATINLSPLPSSRLHVEQNRELTVCPISKVDQQPTQWGYVLELNSGAASV